MLTIKKCGFTALIGLHFLAGAATPAAPAPANAQALRAALTRTMKEQAIPGAAYAIYDRNGVVLSESLGLRNAAAATPVTQATLFRIGSITKTVTALAIMQLVEQGRFSLQTPVAELLPDAPIKNPYAAGAPVRVVHLLTHSAGFDDTHPKAFFADSERRGGHLDAARENPETYQVRWRPGTAQSYSNPGYVLLGAILEAHYRQPWDQVVARQVLLPLGLTQTAALASEALKREHADGHTGTAMRATDPGFEQTMADGALWTSAADLARLGRYLLTDGASAPGVLKAETVRAMKTVQGTLGSAAGLAHGNGLGLRHRIVGGARWQGHSGGVRGALASMHFQPQLGMGYVLLVNSENNLRKMEAPIAAYIARSVPQASAPALAPLATGIDGWYRTTNPRISLAALPVFLMNSGQAKVVGNELQLSAPMGMGYAATLKHRGNGLLADVDDGGEVATGVVIRDAAGTVTGLELNGDYLERSSALAVLLPMLSVMLALPLLASVPFGRRRALAKPWSRRLPSLALLTLVLAIVCIANLNASLMEQRNWQTGGILLCSIAFPVLAVLATVSNVLGWSKETATVAKWRCLLGSLAALVLAGWLVSFGLFGIALWAW